ncbi:MAG TPA: putative lipid II flippase FtsW [Burkholderiaceae bacterium]|jgi:cell division protein FtsW|nr:putative lipid II flippase FtsW [Burkholderiaceae bacterium]
MSRPSTWLRRRKRRDDDRFTPGAATLALAGLGGVGSTRRAAHFDRIDAWLLAVIAALLMFGAVMVYSASIALADSPRYNVSSAHFLIRHAISMLIGTVAAIGAFSIPLEQWQRVARWAFLAAVLLLVAVLVPGIGKGALGAHRWIPLGPLNLQPSELMKLACVLYAADFTVRKQDYMHEFGKGFLPMAGVMAVVGALLLLQPDLGAFGVIVAISMGILFLGGVNGRLFASISVALCAAFMTVIWTSPWRRERIFAYLDPWSADNALTRGYQLSHSLIAFGRGEWFGVGLGASVEKLHYLPEAHTDFIVAVIGEELGLVGVLVVVFAFYWLTRRAFEIGRQAVALDRTFGGLVAQGVGLWIGVQAFINIGVASGLLPTKGLTLPLMSYGGSALLATMVALALLARVDFENRILMRGGVPR